MPERLVGGRRPRGKWRRYGCAAGVFAAAIAMVLSIPMPDALVSLGPSPGIDPMPQVQEPGTGFAGTGLLLLIPPVVAAACTIAGLAARRPPLISGAVIAGGAALVLDVTILLGNVLGDDVVARQVGPGPVLTGAAALIMVVGGLLGVRSGGTGDAQNSGRGTRPHRRTGSACLR